KQARKVADNPSQAGRPAPGKVQGAAPAGWGSRGASVAASTLAERKRVARRSRAGPRASQCLCTGCEFPVAHLCARCIPPQPPAAVHIFNPFPTGMIPGNSLAQKALASFSAVLSALLLLFFSLWI